MKKELIYFIYQSYLRHTKPLMSELGTRENKGRPTLHGMNELYV